MPGEISLRSGSLLARARPLLVARLAGAVLTLAVPMVLARVLVPASYGTFKQAWLLTQTLALVLPMGMTVSLYYFVPREPESRDSHIAQTLWFHLALGGVAAALLLAGAPSWTGSSTTRSSRGRCRGSRRSPAFRSRARRSTWRGTPRAGSARPRWRGSSPMSRAGRRSWWPPRSAGRS